MNKQVLKRKQITTNSVSTFMKNSTGVSSPTLTATSNSPPLPTITSHPNSVSPKANPSPQITPVNVPAESPPKVTIKKMQIVNTNASALVPVPAPMPNFSLTNYKRVEMKQEEAIQVSLKPKITNIDPNGLCCHLFMFILHFFFGISIV